MTVLRHGLLTEQSRKARAAKQLYEHLKQKSKGRPFAPDLEWETIQGTDGLQVPTYERHRVLQIGFHEEHLSPYFKTDMNLFHMLMMDESVETNLYKCEKGWLFLFAGIPTGPKPFGQDGFDTR